jgi:hypothetical protein
VSKDDFAVTLKITAFRSMLLVFRHGRHGLTAQPHEVKRPAGAPSQTRVRVSEVAIRD